MEEFLLEDAGHGGAEADGDGDWRGVVVEDAEAVGQEVGEVEVGGAGELQFFDFGRFDAVDLKGAAGVMVARPGDEIAEW